MNGYTTQLHLDNQNNTPARTHQHCTIQTHRDSYTEHHTSHTPQALPGGNAEALKKNSNLYGEYMYDVRFSDSSGSDTVMVDTPLMLRQLNWTATVWQEPQRNGQA